MRDNVKFDVALEIISSKIAEAMKNQDRELTNKLLDEREEIYLGNWDIIEKVLIIKQDELLCDDNCNIMYMMIIVIDL